MLLDEAAIVIERLNGYEATRAALIQTAMASILSTKAGKQFDKEVKRLTVATKARKRTR